VLPKFQSVIARGLLNNISFLSVIVCGLFNNISISVCDCARAVEQHLGEGELRAVLHQLLGADVEQANTGDGGEQAGEEEEDRPW